MANGFERAGGPLKPSFGLSGASRLRCKWWLPIRCVASLSVPIRSPLGLDGLLHSGANYSIPTRNSS